MRIIKFGIISLAIMLMMAFNASAQVTVSGSTGVDGSYTSVNAAFTAINGGGTQAGNNILVEVSANTTETASASLNAGDWTTLTVRPSVAGVIVEGSIVGAIIKLNGADNVTIDGRVGGVGSNREMTVRNNSTAAATAAIWLASVAAGNGASNNNVRYLELAGGTDTSASANSTFGIIMCGTTISTTANGVDNDNNSFTFNRIIKVRYGIVTRGTTTDLNNGIVVTDNIIGPSAFGTDQINKTGIFMQADTGALVSRNTVQFVGCLDPQACSGADRMGIAIGTESWSATDTTSLTSLNYTVTRNVVHDIVEELTFSSAGIRVGTTQSGGATGNLVANNFVYNIRANGTGGDQVVGIGISAGNGDSVVNNSISITGDMDPGVAAATTQYGNGIRIPGANGTNNANFTVMNNSIYMDASSSSTAANRYYAITLNSAAYVFGTGGLNYNNYYINPANTQLQTGGLSTTTGSTTTTQFATLANWQAALTAPQDANSIQADPLYVSPTADLHIATTSPNVNVGTTIAAVTNDIDGDTRPIEGSYEIGADERAGPAVPGQIQLSSATYAGSEGTTATITVTRTAGTTGAVSVDYTTTSGTATEGTCGTDDYVDATGTLNWASGEGGGKTFTITLCTDVVLDPNETVNIALANATGGATLATPNTAVLTIGDIPPPFNGTYTVGTAGQYTSLTNPGGIFEAINLGGATGPVTIEITSDLTGETGTHPLNPIAGSPNVLIKPSGAPRTISGTAASAVIRINGADNVRIDGSTAAMVVGGNPALRELTIQNNSTSTSSAVIALHSNTDGAQNNIIQNVNVLGNDPLTTLLGISMGGNTVGTVGTDNDGNRVVNCSIRRSQFGIYSAGASSANQNTGTVINQNDIAGLTTERVSRIGIVVFNEDGVQITENSIGGIQTTASVDTIGIGVGTQGVDTTTTTSGAVTNALVARNKINGVDSAGTVGFSSVGIAVAGGTTGANTIANNMITGVTAPSTSPDFPAGIFVAGVTGSTTRLYYNSIAMTGDRGTVNAQMPSYGIAITGTDPTVELKNNIFYTTQTASCATACPAALSYAIGMVTTTFANLDSNYNDFWSAPTMQDGGFRSGSLGLSAGTDYAALAGWQVAVADDTNSVEADPMFVDPLSDLHITALSTSLIDLGTTVSVLDDFDGQIRSVVGLVGGVPDIGADELAPTAAAASISGRTVTKEGRAMSNVFVTVTGGGLTQPLVTRTNIFGRFEFNGLEAGQVYILSVGDNKKYVFENPTRVIDLSEDATGIEIIGGDR